MTTVYDIINDAYRQSNLIALGVEPTQKQEDEALRYLRRIIKSVFGNEMGEQLVALPLGGNNIETPGGFPWYGNTPSGDFYVALNRRVNCNLTAKAVISLHPMPQDGSRFAAHDISGNFSTNTLTVYGNGRLIDGATQVVLNTDGFNAEWMYREDLGTWQKVSPLTKFDTFPFPEEFDDLFILMLAFRLNPAYQREFDQQSMAIFQRSRSQFRARYTNTIQTNSELGLLINSRMVADRDYYTYWRNYYDPQYTFNFGNPW